LKNRIESDDPKVYSWFKSIVLSIVGVAAIIGGGQLVVESAKTIALNLGMGETLVGLTIVAIGTSLPELVTSMVAARKGESDLALGNVVGSNIFNIIFILSFSALVSPMTVDIATLYDIAILIAVSLLSLVLMARRMKVTRRQGILYLSIYILYFVYILLR
jgi:cation:H+ antiporter